MQQEIQSARRDPQSGKTACVGEFPDVETGSLPVSHIGDTATQNDELQPDASYNGACRHPQRAAGNDRHKFSAAAGVMIFLIRIYQKAISPWLPCCCRFEPSRSHYAVEAFQKRGFWMGTLLTIWRLMRCQPFCKSGFDPVPEKGFRSPATANTQTPQKK